MHESWFNLLLQRMRRPTTDDILSCDGKRVNYLSRYITTLHEIKIVIVLDCKVYAANVEL